MPEDDSGIAMTRRRALGSVATVGCASAAAGAGTVALLQDTERSSENTLQAGTLELSVTGDGQSAMVQVDNAGPGSRGTRTATVENVGTLDGSVSFEFAEYESSEGENPDPETDTTGEGELDEALELTVTLGDTEVRSGTFDVVFDGTEAATTVPLASGASDDLVFEWSIPTDVSDDAQGDTVTGTVTIVLTQA